MSACLKYQVVGALIILGGSRCHSFMVTLFPVVGLGFLGWVESCEYGTPLAAFGGEYSRELLGDGVSTYV